MLETAERDRRCQTPAGPGHAGAVEAIAAQRLRRYGISYDPDTGEVPDRRRHRGDCRRRGFGLVEPGSDVILVEPF